ncbi:unnamed protein product, partial [Rotaria socialis]
AIGEQLIPSTSKTCSFSRVCR